MDRNLKIQGFILTGTGAAGSILLSLALSLPVTALLGLLLIIVPILFSLWYLNARVQQLEEITLNSGRQIRRAVEVHATTMARRYDSTLEEMAEMNKELTRRIYR